MKTCNYYQNCTNFKTKHCIKFSHPFREQKCKFSPCRLLHDKNHILNYTHQNQYQIISNNNLQYNKTHPIYIQDIWNIIHKYIIINNCYERVSYNENNSGPSLLLIINNLLLTSKIFNKLLNTQLNFVNDWSNDINNIKYNYITFADTYCVCSYNKCECNIICDDVCSDCDHRYMYCYCKIKCVNCDRNSYEPESSEEFSDY